MKQAILLFIAGALLLVYAQAQQDKKPVPPLEIPLSAEEIEAGRRAAQPMADATVMVNDLLIVAAHHRPTRNAQADRDRLAEMGSRLVLIANSLQDAESDYSAWLESVRKNHNCDACLLQDGKLISKK